MIGRVSALAVAAVAMLAGPASAPAQVFVASRPHPALTVGPLMVRASVTPALGPVTVDVLFSLVVPPDRSAVEQDIYLLWPGAVQGTAGPRDPALARFVEGRGFDVIGEGTVGLYAQNLYRMRGEVPEDPVPGGAPFVTFVHHVSGLGISAPATWIRIPWTPKLVNRAWMMDLRLPTEGLVKPKPGSWLERVFSGARHRIMLSFHDVRGRATFPLYAEHRDHVLRLADDPAQITINFADADHLKIDELSPPSATRRVHETLESTETVAVFIDRSEGITPQTLTVQFGYFTGLQTWAPILIPILFFVAGNVAGVLVRTAAERLSKRFAGRIHFARRHEHPERASGVILSRDTLAQIVPGVSTRDDVLRLCGPDGEEYEEGGQRRRLVYRGRRVVPSHQRRFGWVTTVSRWDVEHHEVEIVFDGDRVSDVQARVRRARLTAPVPGGG